MGGYSLETSAVDEETGEFQIITICNGPTGANGAKGDKGDKGDQGNQGNQGGQGPKGDQGNQGGQGPKGDQGNQGNHGDKGDKGDQGNHGNNGANGADGVQGPKGDTGPPGPQGARGFNILTDPEAMTSVVLDPPVIAAHKCVIVEAAMEQIHAGDKVDRARGRPAGDRRDVERARPASHRVLPGAVLQPGHRLGEPRPHDVQGGQRPFEQRQRLSPSRHTG